MRRINAVVQAFHELPQPTIAKVDGVAAGVGMNLALGCDLVVASDRAASRRSSPGAGLSLDGGGSWLLPRLVGLHRAKELALFADIIPAEEALRLGVAQPRGARRRARQGRGGVGGPAGGRARRSRWR